MSDTKERTTLLERISRAIHLKEWCPMRDKCSGMSAFSDAYARAAIDEYEKYLAEQKEQGK